MDVTHQRDRGAALRALHGGKRILGLPTAWDAARAALTEQAGFPAIATTSAGVAFALGYPDGERIPRSEMVAAVARIAAGVRIPVTADMEAGYGPRPDDVAATVREVIAAGAGGGDPGGGDAVRGRLISAPPPEPPPPPPPGPWGATRAACSTPPAAPRRRRSRSCSGWVW